MSDMVGLPFPADPSERFSDVLPCGCERAQGTWFYCARHQFERKVVAALYDLLEHAKCPDGFAEPNNWERAQQIGSPVAAALVAVTRALNGPPPEALWPYQEAAALDVLIGGSRPATTPETPEQP